MFQCCDVTFEAIIGKNLKESQYKGSSWVRKLCDIIGFMFKSFNNFQNCLSKTPNWLIQAKNV